MDALLKFSVCPRIFLCKYHYAVGCIKLNIYEKHSTVFLKGNLKWMSRMNLNIFEIFASLKNI